MKSWTLIACAGLLALAGCTNSVAQGTTQAKEPVQEQQDASKKQDTSADTNTDVKDTTESKGTANTTTTDGSDVVSKNADRLQQGLKDAGFTVSDYEAELHEVSFDATNGNSFLGADVEYIPNARTSYDHQKNDNDVAVENEYTDGARLMCVVRDLEDNTYEILGVDEDSDVLYDIDDIKSEDIGTVKHIMVQVGFPAE